MFERFAKETRATVERATEIAESEHATLVQSDHLLLALVDPPRDSVGRTLAEAGLTAERIREARDREFRSALASVGVDTGRPTPPPSPRVRRGRTTRFAPSAKLALERALKVCVERGDRRISNRHVLTAIVGAEVGATPALLDELGTTAQEVDRLAGSG